MKSTTTRLMFQIFLFSIFVFSISTADSQPLNLNLLKGLDPNTKQILLKHCNTFVIGKRNIDTTSPSTDIELHCKDLESETLTMKKCDSNCINPTTCRRMIRFQNEAVVIPSTVKDREGNEMVIRLPVACQCVVKDESSIRKCGRGF